MVAIIDYDAGNIKSVEKAVAWLGKQSSITSSREEILKADHIILPGVGAFGAAMERLNRQGLTGTIREAVAAGTPFLGICLGLQLIFDESEESPGVKGIGLMRGKIKRLPETGDLKVPNIGWNSIDIKRTGRLFKDIGQGSFLYFVHSYYLEAEDREVVTAQIDYGTAADVAVEKDNVFAFQFHPEKSSETGLKLLDSFLKV